MPKKLDYPPRYIQTDIHIYIHREREREARTDTYRHVQTYVPSYGGAGPELLIVCFSLSLSFSFILFLSLFLSLVYGGLLRPPAAASAAARGECQP